jgi:hypothetical protein
MHKSFTVTLEEDENGDVILALPKELSEGDYPWLVGDTLHWEVQGDSRVVITNMSWLQRNEDGFG